MSSRPPGSGWSQYLGQPLVSVGSLPFIDPRSPGLADQQTSIDVDGIRSAPSEERTVTGPPSSTSPDVGRRHPARCGPGRFSRCGRLRIRSRRHLTRCCSTKIDPTKPLAASSGPRRFRCPAVRSSESSIYSLRDMSVNIEQQRPTHRASPRPRRRRNREQEIDTSSTFTTVRGGVGQDHRCYTTIRWTENGVQPRRSAVGMLTPSGSRTTSRT